MISLISMSFPLLAFADDSVSAPYSVGINYGSRSANTANLRLETGTLPISMLDGGQMLCSDGPYLYSQLRNLTAECELTSDSALYVSFCGVSNKYPVSVYSGIGPANSWGEYIDANGSVQRLTLVNSDYSTWTPTLNYTYVSNRGFSIKCSFEASSSSPIYDPSIWLATYDDFGTGNYCVFFNSYNDTTPATIITSARLISGRTSAEIEGLENIADQIAAQSDVLSAMYGDIMAVLNSMYSRLGDIQSVLELSNTYFQTIITILQNIDATTVDIYNLLATQFELLISSINTASSDLQAAISAQTAALIAYFDTVFSGAVGDLPQKSEDLDTNIGNMSDSENEYKSNASDKFEEINSAFTGFTGGTLSGISLASTLFTQVWNAFGEYSVVFSFPLLLGIALLLVGRISKFDRSQSARQRRNHSSDSKGGGE